MVPHSSVLAWRIPGTGEPGGLPSMGSHRVGHDWSHLAAAAQIFIWTILCFYFYMIQNIFKKMFVMASLTQVLFSKVLFYFQIFGDFSGIFALLISSSILFCFEYRLWMISALINLLRTVLKLRILLTLSIFPCALGKDIYSFFFNIFFFFVMGYS